MTAPAITFRELLDYTATESASWLGWLALHPDALDVPYGAAPLATVRDVARHVAFVEHRYAAILRDRAVPAATGAPDDDAKVLTVYTAGARKGLEDAIAALDDAGLDRNIEFTTLTAGRQRATARKIVAHALLHGIRHWAQVATVLRQHGYRPDWPHDLLLSRALA